MRYHLAHISMAIIKNKKIKSVREVVEEDTKYKESLYIVGGNVIWCSHYGKQWEVPQKTRNKTAI